MGGRKSPFAIEGKQVGGKVIVQILSGRRIKMLGISLLFGLLMVMVPDYVYAGLDTDIHFSREPGFYEESFYLEIDAGQNKDWTLYYTLDGSMPDTTSQRYTGPILMEDVSYKENVYSAREDVSPVFDKDEMEKYGQGVTTYRIPEEPVDKCNIVRVVAYNEKQELMSEAAGVYFIGFQEKAGYDGMMTVSLAVEPDSLFDFERGIYVTGERCEQFAGKENLGWYFWDANYLGRGKEWERTAVMEVFDVDGSELLSTTAGIRIHGVVTRSFPQKSFNVYAREEYAGDNRFAYDFFDNGIGAHKFFITNCGTDDSLKGRDYIIQNMVLSTELDYAKMKMRPCVLFLNGEYWGMYCISESYDAAYVSTHYGVAKDNVVIVKPIFDTLTVEDGYDRDAELYYEMEEFITTHDMRDDANFDKACEMIDIDSFLDYYATEIYIGNRDWPLNNKALWRVRDKGTGNRYADGRWRYMLFDLNTNTVFGDASEIDVVRVLKDDKIFFSLMNNRTVWDKFWERIDYLENEVFSIENMEGILDQWYETMKEPLGKSNERFYGGGVDTTADMEKEIESIKSFLRERPDWMQGFKNYYIEHGGVFWEDGSLLLQ